MNTLGKVTIIILLLISGSLHAQTTDTATRVPVVGDVVIDTPVVIPQAPDSVIEKRKPRNNGYTINGKIVDANTGEGIPFTPVFFYHTQIGTAADLEGNFVFHLDSLPSDTLRMEALGYKPARRILRASQHDYNFIIDMDRAAADLTEVTVHAGEDPAVVLMRHIIEKKPDNNPDKVMNYQYEAYNRLEADLQRLSQAQFAKMPILKSYTFIFDNLDTQSEAKPYLPLYLTETISDYYFRAQPKKQREFIKASMVKGVNNENVDKYLGSLYQNVNIYRNYIPVFDKKFVSPISNEGLFYYKYKIVDTERAYGHNIILVQYKPRREGENCFVGDFWVVDTVFAIQRMSMDVSKLANINWVNKVSLYQEFAPVDSFWFCTKDKFIAEFSAYNSQKLPGMIGRKTTTYHHIKINDPETEKMLDDPQYKEEIVRSDSARKHSDDWWANSRPDTLTRNERAIYKMVDTINSMRVTTVYKNTITFLSTGVKDFGPIQLGPYYYIYSNNPVEGSRFRFSMGSPRSIKNAHFTGYLAYGTKDQEIKYGGTGLWLLGRHPRMYLYGSYAHDINPPIVNQEQQLSNDNIFSSLFRKPGVSWKLAFKDDTRFEFYKEYFGGFSHKLILRHNDFTPYDPLPYRNIFFDKDGKPAVNVVSSEVGVELRYAYKEKYVEGQYLRVNIGSKYPVLDLQLAAGLKDLLNSGYDYKKAKFSISESINVPPLGHISYSVFTGKYFGKLPYPLLEIHPGNDFLYYNQFAFEMMNTYEFLSDEYAGFFFEHNIGGGVFNHIPGVKKFKLRQFWTAKGVIGSLTPENQQLNLDKGYPFRTLKGDPYLELGTGISNILEVFRLDFVWRVTPKPLPGEAKEKYFGIFGSVKFEF